MVTLLRLTDNALTLLLVLLYTLPHIHSIPEFSFTTEKIPIYRKPQQQDKAAADQPLIGGIKQQTKTNSNNNNNDFSQEQSQAHQRENDETGGHGPDEGEPEIWNRGALNTPDDVKVNNETRLIRDLFKRYDNVARPVLDMRRSVNVEFGYRLLSLQLNEVDQVLTSFVWLPHRWRDERLAWEPDEYGKIDKMIIPNRMLWLPDTFLYQSSDESGYVISFDRVPLDYTGLMEWWPSATLLSPCIIDVTYFPFDYQTCNLTIGPWGYHSAQVNYTLMDEYANLEQYTISGAWELMGTHIDRNEQYYADLGMSYTLIDITIRLKRKALYYWLNVIIPCLLLNTLGVGLFILPPDSGEKVGFGLGILLTVFVFAILVNENIPKTSDYTPIIGIYLVLIMVMISFSLFLAIIIVNLHHRRPKLSPPSKWMKNLFLKKMPYVLRMKLPELPLCTGFSMQGMTPKKKKKMKMMRRLRDQFKQQEEDDSTDRADIPLNGHGNQFGPNRSGTLAETTIRSSVATSGTSYTEYKKTEKDRLEEAYKNMPFDEKDNDEWILVALVLDRLLLWCFLVLLIISSSLVLVIVPASQKTQEMLHVL